MKLDSRILEGKTYLDCFDTEVAKGFIGKECYLSDGVASFANVDNLNKAVLIEVDDENIKPYTLENIRWRYSSNFILPCEWVKEPEKKYRAFTLAEWIDQHEIGEVIHCRNEHKQEFHVMYTGYVIDNGEEDIQDNRTTGRIMLINMGYLLQELFERYEICIDGEWQPFGVIEDD